MADLFGNTPGPPGFVYQDNFITIEEELLLLNQIRKITLHTFNFHGYQAKRNVRSFGFDYSFENKTLTERESIPEVFTWLVERVAIAMRVPASEVAELLVTEYPAGAVINWHRDAPPFDGIAGVSLLSDCTFKFRPYEKALQKRNATISYPVRRRSLYLIQNEARTDWMHSIAPVQGTRYSITLRTLRKLRAEQLQ